MGTYGETKLPEVVLQGLDRGESRWGRILMWMTGGLFAFMAIMFFVTPEPIEEKLPTIPWVVGVFAVMFGLSFWNSRKHLRVATSRFARTLRDAPQTIVAVTEELVQPSPGGGRVQRAAVPFDGEREFAPRKVREVRVLGFRFTVRSWVMVKVEGRLLREKLVVPCHEAPTLLSYLFALAAQHNPDCAWGKGTVGQPAGGQP